MNITLRQLEAFIALSRTLNFSEAARATHLSQPALSTAIKRMEEILGVTLFERTTRRVLLTDVGREFQRLAEQLSDNVKNTQSRIREYASGKRGRLVIAAGPSIAASFLPAVIADFTRRSPEVDVQLHDELSDVCVEMLRTGKADLAVTPELRDEEGLKIEELFRDYLVAIFPKDHPLKRKRTLGWSDIEGYPQIAVNSRSQLRQTLNAQSAQHGVEFTPAYEVAGVPTMLGLISEGLGIGVLSESLLERSNLEGLAFRKINAASAYRRICASVPAKVPPSPALTAFLETCRVFAKRRKSRA